MEHFGQLEAGRPATMQGLLQICATRQLQHLFDAPRHLHFSELPSVFMLEDSFRQTQADKATGDDPLPSDFSIELLVRWPICTMICLSKNLFGSQNRYNIKEGRLRSFQNVWTHDHKAVSWHIVAWQYDPLTRFCGSRSCLILNLHVPQGN